MMIKRKFSENYLPMILFDQAKCQKSGYLVWYLSPKLGHTKCCLLAIKNEKKLKNRKQEITKRLFLVFALSLWSEFIFVILDFISGTYCSLYYFVHSSDKNLALFFFNFSLILSLHHSTQFNKAKFDTQTGLYSLHHHFSIFRHFTVQSLNIFHFAI